MKKPETSAADLPIGTKKRHSMKILGRYCYWVVLMKDNGRKYWAFAAVNTGHIPNDSEKAKQMVTTNNVDSKIKESEIVFNNLSQKRKDNIIKREHKYKQNK